MVARVMRRAETLLLIAGTSLLILIFCPSLVARFNSYMTSETKQFPTALKQGIYMRSFYDVEEWLKDVKSYDFLGQRIVHGIRKPHPAQRSRRARRLNLFQELVRRRPWPRFSPGPQPLNIVEDEHSNAILSEEWESLSVSKSNLSDFNINRKHTGYLIKDLYRESHVRTHPELCDKKSREGTADIKLLIIVSSAPRKRNARARAAIRRTWGRRARGRGVVLAFLLGKPTVYKQDEVLKEDNAHADLILSHIRDSHSNSSLKTISLLEWVGANCPRARTVLKTNDNVFINVDRLLDFITAPNQVNDNKTIWGKLMKDIHPERYLPSSRYYFSPKEFPMSVLPDFVMGAAYLLSSDAIRPLFKMASELPILRLEDVFVTGILAEAAGIRRVHVDEFFKYDVTRVTCDIQEAIAFDKVQYKDMVQLWKKIQVCKSKKIKIESINITRNKI